MERINAKFSDEKYSKNTEKMQPFKQEMLHMLTGTPAGNVLDIGCGSGVLSRRLVDHGWNTYGMDISFEGVRKYRLKGLKGVVCDAEMNLPFRDELFDTVWISEVIEHMVDYRSLLMEIRRVLKRHGRVYLTTPNASFFGYRLLSLLGRCPTEMQHPYHLRFFSFRFLEKVLETNGFQIENRLGQNIYMVLPKRVLRMLERMGRTRVHALLRWMGFQRMEGLIHGDKMVLLRFSTFHPQFFSNAIMLVASKDA